MFLKATIIFELKTEFKIQNDYSRDKVNKFTCDM